MVATDSMSAAGNAAMTYLNVQSLGAKGLAKKTAKNTGKTLAKNVIQAHVGTNDKSNLKPSSRKICDNGCKVSNLLGDIYTNKTIWVKSSEWGCV